MHHFVKWDVENLDLSVRSCSPIIVFESVGRKAMIHDVLSQGERLCCRLSSQQKRPVTRRSIVGLTLLVARWMASHVAIRTMLLSQIACSKGAPSRRPKPNVPVYPSFSLVTDFIVV